MCCHLKCIPALPPSHITSFLRICSPSALMSPCYPSTFWCNYGVLFVFQGVFRITTKENVEYLLQAANEEEREEWTTAIANAVRRLDIKSKVITSFNGAQLIEQEGKQACPSLSISRGLSIGILQYLKIIFMVKNNFIKVKQSNMFLQRTDSEEVRKSVYSRTPVQFTPTQIRYKASSQNKNKLFYLEGKLYQPQLVFRLSSEQIGIWGQWFFRRVENPEKSPHSMVRINSKLNLHMTREATIQSRSSSSFAQSIVLVVRETCQKRMAV